MLIDLFDRHDVIPCGNVRKSCILHASTDTPAKSHNARMTSNCHELEILPRQCAASRCNCCPTTTAKIRHGTVAVAPSCGTNLAPPDFFLFPELKRLLKRHQFNSIQAVQAGSTTVFRKLTSRELLTSGRPTFEDY